MKVNNKIVDIHTHIINNVDDGSKSIEESIELIKEEISLGVTDIILTPHYRPHMFKQTNDDVNNNFKILKDKVKELKLPINLYLGREIYYTSSSLEELYDNNIQTMNNKPIVLIEFSYTERRDICDIVNSLAHHNITAIIAHIERYQYIDSIDILQEIKELGSYIQVNASTICGVDGLFNKFKAFNYIKQGLVDFISSDIHYTRRNYIKKAYNIIRRRFGKETASKLFETNARELFNI